MANNDLMVTVGLNVDASVDNIEKQLKTVNERLDKDHALKIIGNIDLGKTTQRIQSQLATISKNLNLDIGGINLNTANINNSISQSVSAIKAGLTKGIDVNIPINDNAITDFADALSRIDDNIPDEAIEKLSKSLDGLLVRVTKIKPAFTQLAGETERSLSSLAISGIDKFGNLVNYVEKFDLAKDQDNGKSTITITQNLAEIEKANKRVEDSAKAAQIAYNDFLKLKGQADVYSKRFAGEDSLKTQLADIQQLVSDFDNTQPLEKQREGIIKIDNALKVLKVDIDNIQKASTSVVSKSVNDYYPTIAKISSTDKSSKAAQLDTAKTTLNDFFKAENIEDSANRIKRAVEDTSGELQRFYVQVEKGDKSVETLTYALNEQGNAYEYLGKTIREADNSTDFRRKDITTQWDIQTQKLQQFITNAEKAGAASTVLSDDIANLKSKLDSKGDTSAMNSFLDDFDIAKAKFQAFNAEVRKDNTFANLQNRIKRLTADVNAYGEANERATKSMRQMSNGKTFAVEWSRITTEMAKGADLTDRELKDLSADMAVFRKEAQAAGLAGESAFGKFANSFKVMSSYITANMVFNFVKRQLRDMVQEVTAVDTAMVELRKVTEATDEQFEAFAISAGKTGRELGASVSDVINATATFARLGESLPDAEELGKVATLYKNVGDGIDITTASEDIISTMKAFKIEASDAITIVDKLNEVGNNFAISSGGIGEALKRSASALAAANNDISQSIALITTANTIAQDPTTVGQGIKTVSLRLRSTKSQLIDLGEDAEGAAENVSKLREQMLALTGVDIQLDDDTYKSTYQILLEISKVWGRLSDLSRSSVLEQLFGKRQANIGAAILENGDLLERVYKTSERASDGIGSAMREQEEYAKSIQYSIDTLKAAYQDFADSVINSDFVKNLLGTAQSFLEVLTKIIDKFGTLPTILTGIAAIGGIKGVGKLTEYAYLRSVAK